MRRHLITLAMISFACSDKSGPSFSYKARSEDASAKKPIASEGDNRSDGDESEEEEKSVEEDTSAADVSKSTDSKPMPSTKDEAKASEPDPDTLSFPVVIHLGGSGVWKSEAQLLPVVAEAQRILLQAKVEILPRYVSDMESTDNLDVYFVPTIQDFPGTNGISYGGGAVMEVFVIDDVGLGKVDDKRPPEASVPRYVPGAKPGDKVPVSSEEAEQGRTLAHEIGHQLGLPHRQDNTNLLASGTTGWTLNDAEIETVRNTAVSRFKAKFMKTLDP